MQDQLVCHPWGDSKNFQMVQKHFVRRPRASFSGCILFETTCCLLKTGVNFADVLCDMRFRSEIQQTAAKFIFYGGTMDWKAIRELDARERRKQFRERR